MSQQSSGENSQTCLQPVYDLLNKVTTERKSGNLRVCEVLAIDPIISRILQERENGSIAKPFSKLLDGVSKIVEKCAVKRTISDWPFENFWGSPNEPKHSKMLAYFIDPSAKHGFGIYLLEELLRVCRKEKLKIDSHCKVISEKDHIDIRVTRKTQINEITKNDCIYNYAIIIENKIHGAVDQPGTDGANGQLDTYVEVINKKYEFEYNDIHVFYLPLRDGKDPRSEDKQAIIRKIGSDNYQKITFETEILTWLKTIIDKEVVAEKEGMRDNLNHYKDLITYLINKNKESKMSTEIFEQIQKIENEEGKLPSLEAVQRVQASLIELVPCLQIHKTLKAVEAEIRRQKPQAEIENKFPFDDGKGVGVKFSCLAAKLWFVYGLSDGPDDKTWFFVCQYTGEPQQQLNGFETNMRWNGEAHFPFKYACEVLGEGINFNTPDLSETTAQIVAKKLLEWRGHAG